MSSPGVTLLKETLLNTRLITEQQWSYAEKTAQVRGASLEKILVEMGIIEAEKLGEIAEMLYGIPRVSVDDYAVEPACLALLPRPAAERYQAVPLYVSGSGRLTIAMVDPMDRESVAALSSLLQRELRPVWIGADDLQRALRLYDAPERGGSALDRILDGLPAPADADLARQMAEDAPVARLSSVLLTQAVQWGATALHLEPGEEEAQVRLRVDGAMRALTALRRGVFTALLSRFKRLAGMDPASALPQRGRCEMAADGHALELRLASAPCLHGEQLVVHIGDAARPLPDLDALGFSAAGGERLRSLLAQPGGLILVTGPAGSGRTTTLYAALRQLATPDRTAQSVEDPVERPLPGVNQLDAAGGLGFAEGVRALLGQDPDVLMVGDLRDGETARLAAEAALAGRFVLAGMAGRDAVGALPRLVETGVPAATAASAARGVIAQRLVRRLCPECSTEEVEGSGRRAVGCAVCGETGYRGRLLLAEVLLLASEASAGPAPSLREEATAAVAAGRTTWDEVRRALGAGD